MAFPPDEIPCQYVTDEDGKNKAVLLGLPTFQQLLEDIEDLASITEQGNMLVLPHHEVIAELIASGLLFPADLLGKIHTA